MEWPTSANCDWLSVEGEVEPTEGTGKFVLDGIPLSHDAVVVFESKDGYA